MEDPLFRREGRPIETSLVNLGTNEWQVVGMKMTEKCLNRKFNFLRGITIDSIEFVRPREMICTDVPFERTKVCNFLCFFKQLMIGTKLFLDALSCRHVAHGTQNLQFTRRFNSTQMNFNRNYRAVLAVVLCFKCRALTLI